MPLTHETMITIVDDNWRMLVGQDIQPVNVTMPFGNSSDYLTGIVCVTGAYMGAVTVIVPRKMITSVASDLFSLPETGVGREEMADVCGELTNMIGGNIKAQLPQISSLSLPAVVDGNDYRVALPHCQKVIEQCFQSGEHVVGVQLLLKREEASRNEAPHAIEQP